MRDEAKGSRAVIESTERLVESAKQRLHLWNITDDQIAELEKNREAWQPLLEAAGEGNITLVFGARDVEYNNAVALKSFLEKRLKSTRPRARHRLAVAG